MIDPVERVRLDWVSVRPSPIHGFGLFAQAFIPAESYIGDYAGRPVAQDGRYVLWVEEDDGSWSGVDGSNALRYLNHNAAPNAELNGIELYAIADIERGEEITIHYGEDWAEGAPEDPDSVVAA